MRLVMLLAGLVGLVPAAVRSEPLSKAARAELLESLDKLRATANSKIDARYRQAISRYRSAMSTDKAALEFYLECVELVNFKNQQKKTSDFLEWKSQEHDRHGDPAFRLALQYQLKWLVLTLQAGSDRADLDAVAGEAQDVIESVFQNADRLTGQDAVLSQAVTSTVFARAYEIGAVDAEGWPLSPIQVAEFYESQVFPSLRRPSRVTALRAAWQHRIQLERTRVEAWGIAPKGGANNGNGGNGGNGGSNGRGRDRGERRIGMANNNNNKNVALDKFVAETLPELQWQMEMDLFRSGDESGAAPRMLGLIEKHLQHRLARPWTEQLRTLLSPPENRPTTAVEPSE